MPLGRFEVPSSASGRVKGHFRQSSIPPLCVYIWLIFSHIPYFFVLRSGIGLVPKSNPNGRQAFSAVPRALHASRASCFAPPNHNGAADSRSSATVMNFFCLPRETSSTAICRRANFFLDSAAERAREPRSMPRIVLARQTKLQKDQTEEPRDSPPPLLPPLALLTIY